MTAGVLRALAIAIAVLAVIDPALSRSTTDRPFVSVIASSPDDSADAVRIRERLRGDFRPLAAAFSAADATVIVGDALPDQFGDLASPVFTVPRPASSPRLAVERIRVPSATVLDSRLAVRASLQALGAENRPIQLSLRADDNQVATASITASSSDTAFSIELPFAPSSATARRLRVEATVDGAPIATADVALPVVPDPWSVVFHDPRASWGSTFVRRAVELDPRFRVASRITTTRGAPSDANAPPRLDDRAALAAVDVIVVGAPELLGDAEVAALDRFIRERGGSVILLLDQPVPASARALARLAGADSWTRRLGGDALPIGAEARKPNGLRAIELAWPARLPVGAEPIAFTNVASRSDSLRHPVVWGVQSGAGHLVVSGALDAWRFRDASQSSFDLFWRELIAAEAARAVPRLDVEVTPSVLRPGDEATARVSLRGNTTATTATAGAELNGELVRLWPTEAIGTFTARVRAPATEGSYRLRVAIGRDSTSAPVIVRADARPPRPANRGALASFATSTGGAAAAEPDLVAAIRAAIRPAAREEPWHPMRSAWWIVPFALLLSAEWLMRRRRGLA